MKSKVIEDKGEPIKIELGAMFGKLFGSSTQQYADEMSPEQIESILKKENSELYDSYKALSSGGINNIVKKFLEKITGNKSETKKEQQIHKIKEKQIDNRSQDLERE